MVNMAKGLQDWAEEERAEGRREGIQSMVEVCKHFDDSREIILTMAKEKVHVSEKEADEVVNIAKGLQDWAEEERAEGRREGIQSMVRIFVKNMLKCGMSDEDILMLSECDRELLEEVKKSI